MVDGIDEIKKVLGNCHGIDCSGTKLGIFKSTLKECGRRGSLGSELTSNGPIDWHACLSGLSIPLMNGSEMTFETKRMSWRVSGRKVACLC